MPHRSYSPELDFSRNTCLKAAFPHFLKWSSSLAIVPSSGTRLNTKTCTRHESSSQFRYQRKKPLLSVSLSTKPYRHGPNPAIWLEVGFINRKSTGLFPPGAALGGGGCFPPPSVRLDPDILESWRHYKKQWENVVSYTNLHKLWSR